MLNKMKIFLIWNFLFYVSALYAQDELSKVTLSVDKLEILNNQMNFRFILYNYGNHGLTIYKPYINDICSGILKLHLINSQTNKKHEVFPCSEIYDLGAIILNDKNCIYIDKDEGLVKYFSISIKEITPYLDKGTYLFFVEYNLKDVFFKTDLKDVFKEDIMSNKIKIEY